MNLSDIILQQVTKNVAGSNIQIPSNVQNQVLGGLSESILGSLTKTAATPGGLDLVKNLLTGKSDAASSPVTDLAKNLFTKNILSKLNLGSIASALTGLILGGTFLPMVMLGLHQTLTPIHAELLARYGLAVPDSRVEKCVDIGVRTVI